MTDQQDVSGTVWAVFGHRLAIEASDGRYLADLGPKGAQGVRIAAGDKVSLTGECRPSEIKVASITLGDGTSRTIAWPSKPEHGPADPAVAIAAAQAGGYAVEGEPRRKPKHFEVLGTKDGARHELHVTFDGTIRKTKSVTGSLNRLTACSHPARAASGSATGGRGSASAQLR